MTYLLRIDVSARGAASHSRRFAEEAMPQVLGRFGIERIVRRDLTTELPMTIDGPYVDAMLTYRSREASAAIPACHCRSS